MNELRYTPKIFSVATKKFYIYYRLLILVHYMMLHEGKYIKVILQYMLHLSFTPVSGPCNQQHRMLNTKRRSWKLSGLISKLRRGSSCLEEMKFTRPSISVPILLPNQQGSVKFRLPYSLSIQCVF